jgi:hypothetical protein
MGQKHATLVVSVGPGNWTSATLEGEAVAALCTNRVVFCNYAHHYSGVVSWRGEGGHANVDVVKGVASCNATTGDGAGMTSGSGLIAVEFGKDDEMPAGFYRITVACPIRYPPEPARPAELGHDEFGSYKQPLPSGVTVEQVHAGPPNLKGSISEGGDGVSWNLCPNSQYRLGRPEEDSPDEHRCRP